MISSQSENRLSTLEMGGIEDELTFISAFNILKWFLLYEVSKTCLCEIYSNMPNIYEHWCFCKSALFRLKIGYRMPPNCQEIAGATPKIDFLHLCYFQELNAAYFL
jgi:hypothetical protein